MWQKFQTQKLRKSILNCGIRGYDCGMIVPSGVVLKIVICKIFFFTKGCERRPYYHRSFDDEVAEMVLLILLKGLGDGWLKARAVC